MTQDQRSELLRTMELLQTKTHIIAIDGSHSLWIPKDGSPPACLAASKLGSLVGDLECLGIIHGILGKITLPLGGEQYLLVIAEKKDIGKLPGVGHVYKIERVVSIPLSPTHVSEPLLENLDIPENLLPCPKHKKNQAKKNDSMLKGILDVSPKAASDALQFTIGALKTIKTATSQAKETVQQQMKIGGADSKAPNKERLQRRIFAEVISLLNEPDSFYFSTSGDLSKSVQVRLGGKVLLPSDRTGENGQSESKSSPDKLRESETSLWARFEDRFFWNKSLLKDFLTLSETDPSASRWIIPVLMGYVEIRRCRSDALCPTLIVNDPQERGRKKFPDEVVLALVSRRSRYRAGTRYRSRGVDDTGNVSNYVETEQILAFGAHLMSMVIVRGSIPIFWSQPGFKYRPPPRLDKGFTESQEAFRKHLENEIALYKHVSIINLVQQEGSESVLSKAFLEHILAYDTPDLDYVTFDFHQNCRGLKFHNVGILIQSVEEIIRDTGFCWADREGLICVQKGVFRVNCVDCLDRTNVVQAALARAVLEWQLNKLGMLAPGLRLGAVIQRVHQSLWANNGDSISRQYAGTKALKGDFTRTGERKFAGLMKDGMNSANRYYLSQFRDAYRQGAFNLLQGVEDTTSLMADDGKDDLVVKIGPGNRSGLATSPGPRRLNSGCSVGAAGGEELSPGSTVTTLTSEDVINRVKALLVECQAELVPDPASVLGAWGLIDADPVTGDPNETDVDCILILTQQSYIVVMYDETLEQIEEYRTVELTDVVAVELGHDPRFSTSLKISSLLPGRKDVSPSANSPSAADRNQNGPHGRARNYILRISYKFGGESGFYHQFRSSDLRFFNNMALPMKSEEEKIESLRAIGETICIASNAFMSDGDEYIDRLSLVERRSSLDSKKSRLLKESSTRKSSASLNFLSSFDLNLSALPRSSSGMDNVSPGDVTRKANVPTVPPVSPLKASITRMGSRALTNVGTSLSKFNPMSAINRSIRRAQNSSGGRRLSGGMDQEARLDSSLAPPSASMATSASFTSGDSDRDGVALGDDFISSCGIISVVDQPAKNSTHLDEASMDGRWRNKTPEIKILADGEAEGLDEAPDGLQVGEKALIPGLSRPLNISLQESSSTSPSFQLSPADFESFLNDGSGGKLDRGNRSLLALNFTSPETPPLSCVKQSRSDTCISKSDTALSPSAKLLHGLAKVGANLDPRKKKGSVSSLEQDQALLERELACKTRIIHV